MHTRVTKKENNNNSHEMTIEHYNSKGKKEMVVKCKSNFLSNEATEEFGTIFTRQFLEG